MVSWLHVPVPCKKAGVVAPESELGENQDDVPESVAQKLLDAAPGLFVRKPDGKLAVTNARHHEKHLEKEWEGGGVPLRTSQECLWNLRSALHLPEKPVAHMKPIFLCNCGWHTVKASNCNWRTQQMHACWLCSSNSFRGAVMKQGAHHTCSKSKCNLSSVPNAGMIRLCACCAGRADALCALCLRCGYY
eukprot:1142368-Pelagomonas_calceolata.AAC.7